MLKVISIAAAATLAAAAVTSPAAARDDGAVAAGIIGGLAVGAVVGSQMYQAPQRHYYGGPAYSHQYYEPVYGACHWEREQFTDRWGNYRVRNVKVCD